MLALLVTAAVARTSHAAPDDPVVFAPHPAAVAKERSEQIAFTAEEDLGERPLVIYGPEPREPEPAEHTTVIQSEEPAPIWWLGLGVSPVFAPIPASGRVEGGADVLTTNRFRACLYPHEARTCGVVKGFDFKVQVFRSGGTRKYPRLIGYVRSGYAAGRVSVAPREGGARTGDAMAIRYLSAPIFVGGNAYAFIDFPVRPYAGLGAGVDILRLDYTRFDAATRTDASGRVGLELHAGIEARITNFVSVHAEVMQQWSARRRLEALPDVSPTGLSVLLGVTAAIPLNLDEARATKTTVRHWHTRAAR